ncbi:MAG: hypothetical protein IJ365_03750 [Clostridia bacterium]|nr:hypothetical protein [Clostridia bacterium]
MLPYLSDNIKKKSKSVSAFKGINNTENRGEGELTSSLNMSAEHYPAVSVRQSRSIAKTADVNINGAAFYNSLFYTGCSDGSTVCSIYYGENTATVSSDCDAAALRSFAAISDSILILPDNKLYTPSDNSVTELVSEQQFTRAGALEKAEYECNKEITEYPDYVGTLHSDGIYSAAISGNGYDSVSISPKGLAVGDIVHVSMEVHPVDALQDKDYFAYLELMKEGFFAKISGLDTMKHKIYQGTITDVTNIYFDEGVINMGGYAEVTVEAITISYKMPKLEHICAHGNRVWGTEGNSILCSALGKAGVWYDYSADTFGTLPSSSYSVEVDSGGEFTGICSFNGSILAFKQNCLHMIHGTEPENYTLYTRSCNGVEQGAGNTLVVINGVLYYKGTDGFYSYNGGIPVCISRNIDLDGTKALYSATDGTNYYTIAEKNGETQLLVYYPDKGIWHAESINNASLLVGNSPDIYAVCGRDIVHLHTGEVGEDFEWSFEMNFDEDTYSHKYYTRVFIKYGLADNGSFTVTTLCDDNTHLTHINGAYEHTDKGYSIAVLPRIRCRDMKLRFSGKGMFKLYNITREYCLLDEKD